MISRKLEPFGTTIFSEMTRLAQQHACINLSQGFPDFDGPPELLDAAYEAMRAGENQYARSMGHPRLVSAVTAERARLYGETWNAETEATVFSGATEGIASSLLGLLDPGDEVIAFEPFYDSYPACVAMAGASLKLCTLRWPDFSYDPDELAALFTPRTKVLLLNTPHNPTGKVFTAEELDHIGALCREHGAVVVADEVYEHLVFDGAEHTPMATRPGMRDHVLTLSSAGKTWSLTGWKVGWGVGPAPLIAAAQAAHQFVTFATATPLQVAVAWGIENLSASYLARFRAGYARRRTLLMESLTAAGLDARAPQGTYFVLADFRPVFDGDDRAFVRHLIENHGVAAIPPSVFYRESPEEGAHLARFAFCKTEETLTAAARRLAELRT